VNHRRLPEQRADDASLVARAGQRGPVGVEQVAYALRPPLILMAWSSRSRASALQLDSSLRLCGRGYAAPALVQPPQLDLAPCARDVMGDPMKAIFFPVGPSRLRVGAQHAILPAVRYSASSTTGFARPFAAHLLRAGYAAVLRMQACASRPPRPLEAAREIEIGRVGDRAVRSSFVTHTGPVALSAIRRKRSSLSRIVASPHSDR